MPLGATPLRFETDTFLEKRAIAGGTAYLVTTTYTLFTPLARDLPWVFYAQLGLAIAVLLLRIFLVVTFETTWPRSPKLWRSLYGLTAIGTIAGWATIAVLSIAIYGFSTSSMLMLIAVAGIVAGGTPSMAASRAITFPFIIVGLLPLIIAGFILGGTGTFTSIMLLVLAVFFMGLARDMARQFRELHSKRLLLGKKNDELALERREALLRAEELERAKQRADEANRAKSAFLANISHEIRTPLNGVLGMTHLCLETDLNAQQRQWLRLAHGSAESLLDLLNQVLDLSKIESGSMEIERIPFDLREVIVDLCKLHEHASTKKPITFIPRVDDSVPNMICGDKSKLRQVLLNLLGNATKFTSSGTITISATREDEDSIVFAVTDTGIGIPQDKKDDIFRTFAQADNSISRRFGGTGLGLSISARLVEMMGGKLEVDSREGEGSRFFFRLPLSPARDDKVQTPGLAQPHPKDNEDPGDRSDTPHGLRTLQVLLAEDNRVNQIVAMRLIEHLGHTVSVVDDGQGAIDATADPAHHFDLVMMDVQMPGIDGIQATAAIRQREQESGDRPIPIVALTAHALTQDRERCLAAGMNDYLAKPINDDALGKILTRYAKLSDSPSAPDEAKNGENTTP